MWSHVSTLHTHTYLIFAFSLINTDSRNTAMDPRWGRVIHQTLPSLPSLIPPIQEGSGSQTGWHGVQPGWKYMSHTDLSMFVAHTHTILERWEDWNSETACEGVSCTIESAFQYLHPLPESFTFLQWYKGHSDCKLEHIPTRGGKLLAIQALVFVLQVRNTRAWDWPVITNLVATMQASERRSLKHKMEEAKQELRLANKALTEVSSSWTTLGL